MDHFELRSGVIHAEDVPLTAIADAVGTPVYVYSRATLTRHARVFNAALAALPNKHVAFAVKSNPNLAVLRLLAREGFGADVVSGGELDRALAADVDGQAAHCQTREHRQAAIDPGGAIIGHAELVLRLAGRDLAVGARVHIGIDAQRGAGGETVRGGQQCQFDAFFLAFQVELADSGLKPAQ